MQEHDATIMKSLRGRDIALAKNTDYKELLLRNHLLSAEEEMKIIMKPGEAMVKSGGWA